MSTCDGACCRGFVLPFSPAELEASKGGIHDGAQIADMVVHLGWFDVGQAPPGQCAPLGAGAHYYTCRHLGEDGRTCGIYDTRPRMCWGFPYDRACPFEGCTWEAGRDVAHPSRLAFRLGGVTHLRMVGGPIALVDPPGARARWGPDPDQRGASVPGETLAVEADPAVEAP